MSNRRLVPSPIVLSALKPKALSRRRMLQLTGALAGGAALTACIGGGDDDSLDTTSSGGSGSGSGSSTCTVTPSLTEGPFFVDEMLNRSDIRPNTSGVAEPFISTATPLYLTISVYNSSSSACTPLQNVQIDVWHCHAGGLYSDVSSGQNTNTSGRDFLRGYQVTDANGVVRFTTIYPGWYSGRTVHVHLKARIYNASGNSTLSFNTQGFFDDAVSDVVMANAPYNTRGARDTRNAADNIYGGRTGLLFALTQNADGSYNGSLTIGLNA